MANGENFRSLLQTATGKDYADIGEADVERWASAQGWRQKDVRRIVKGFTKFSKRDNDFNLAGPGEFRVAGEFGSGQRKGNVKGFDVGDIVGLGRDVSLLGGALETIQTGGGEEKVTPDVGGTLTTDDPFKLEPLFTPVPDEKADVYRTPSEKADAATASGAGATQAAGQRNQDVQTSRSPKQTILPEGLGDIALGPNDIFDLSAPLPKLLSPLDKSINVEGASSTKAAASTKAEKGINVYGFSNPIGKDDDGYYEIQSTGKKKYISPNHKRYQHVKDTVEQGGERDIGSLMGRAAQNLGKVFESYKEQVGKTQARSPGEMFPFKRFGGKTKFSKNVSI